MRGLFLGLNWKTLRIKGKGGRKRVHGRAEWTREDAALRSQWSNTDVFSGLGSSWGLNAHVPEVQDPRLPPVGVTGALWEAVTLPLSGLHQKH